MQKCKLLWINKKIIKYLQLLMIKMLLKKPYFSFLFSLRRKPNYHDTNPYSLIPFYVVIQIIRVLLYFFILSQKNKVSLFSGS